MSLALAASAETVAPPAPPKEGGRSTRFDFEFAMFHIAECVFRRSAENDQPGLYMPLGGGTIVFLSLDDVERHFKKDLREHDLGLLKIVGKSLSYVREIRHGDSIPNEILDGSASWRVDPIHRSRARGRLFASLIGQVSADISSRLLSGDLGTLEADPEFRALLNRKFEELAVSSGLGAGNRNSVVDRVEQVGRELSYVEGLRDRYGTVGRINAKIRSAAAIYSKVKGLADEIARILVLLDAPTKTYQKAFQNLDGQTSELRAMLKNMPATIGFIRKSRDRLHQQLLVWDCLIETWDSEDANERSKRLEGMLRDAYKFAARHFPQGNDWSLSR